MWREKKIEEEKKEGGTYIVPALALLQGDSEKGRERERKRKKKKRTDLIFAACTNFGLHQFTHTKKKKKGVGLWGRGHKNQTACHTQIRAKKKKKQGQNFGGGSEIVLQFITSVTALFLSLFFFFKKLFIDQI